MSTTAYQLPRRYKLTVEKYHRMADAGIFAPDTRTELVGGEIIEMSPIGSIHAGITRRLISLFTRCVGETAIVDAQNPIVIGVHSEPQPDIALLRWREDFYVSSHPQCQDVLLLVEISDTTLAYDRDVKIPLYAEAGIPEVWLIDAGRKHLDIYRQPEEHRYTSQQRAKDLRCMKAEALPEIQFDLFTLFHGI